MTVNKNRFRCTLECYILPLCGRELALPNTGKIRLFIGDVFEFC